MIFYSILYLHNFATNLCTILFKPIYVLLIKFCHSTRSTPCFPFYLILEFAFKDVVILVKSLKLKLFSNGKATCFYVNCFLVLLCNRLISSGLEQVLSHIKKLCIAVCNRQFSTGIKIKVRKLMSLC